jgi:hypothetical protein
LLPNKQRASRNAKYNDVETTATYPVINSIVRLLLSYIRVDILHNWVHSISQSQCSISACLVSTAINSKIIGTSNQCQSISPTLVHIECMKYVTGSSRESATGTQDRSTDISIHLSPARRDEPSSLGADSVASTIHRNNNTSVTGSSRESATGTQDRSMDISIHLSPAR